MNKTFVEHQGKKYPIKELTIDTWGNIMKYKNILDEMDLYIKTISEMTGLTPEEIKESEAEDILETGEQLYNFINRQSKEVYYTFNHRGVEYELCDFSMMSFGQFVDIDTFMSKDEAYRISNLNELASYLFTEKGTKYGGSDFRKKAELFKDLPFRIIEGAVFFFMDFRKGITRTYSGLFAEQVAVEDTEDKNNFSQFWGYYIWITQLAENKIWKIDSITNLPLILCLNHLSFLADLRTEQDKAMKKQMKAK